VKITIRDLLWLTTVVALTLGLYYSWQKTNGLIEGDKLLHAELNSQEQANDLKVAQLRADVQTAEGANRKYIVADTFLNRGIALYDLDRLAEAAAAFEVAHRNSPDNLAVLDYLIRIYEMVGNERAAEKYKEIRQTIDLTFNLH